MSARPSGLNWIEIELLKHLKTFAGIGFPITVPRNFNRAFLMLWRLGLIEIWYRQDRDAAGGRRTQFISITVDGALRADAIMSSTNSRRLAGSLGRRKRDDKPPEPQQGQGHG